MTQEDAGDQPLEFEAALAELEALVEKMERGELTLDASLSAFERGIHLTRTCQRALDDATARVQQLLAREDGDEIVDAPTDGAPGDETAKAS